MQSWARFRRAGLCKLESPQSQVCRRRYGISVLLSQDRAVRVKAEVVEVGVPRADKAYWNIPPSDDKTCKLQLVAEYDGDALNESVLMEHGFKGGGSIELPLCGNTQLLDYIEEQFNK